LDAAALVLAFLAAFSCLFLALLSLFLSSFSVAAGAEVLNIRELAAWREDILSWSLGCIASHLGV